MILLSSRYIDQPPRSSATKATTGRWTCGRWVSSSTCRCRAPSPSTRTRTSTSRSRTPPSCTRPRPGGRSPLKVTSRPFYLFSSDLCLISALRHYIPHDNGFNKVVPGVSDALYCRTPAATTEYVLLMEH